MPLSVKARPKEFRVRGASLPAIMTELGIEALVDAAGQVLLPLPLFVLIGLLVKGRSLMGDALRALPEFRLNLLIHFFDALFLLPVAVFLSESIGEFIEALPFALSRSFWEGFPPISVVFLTIFAGDFVGYWRHRLEHFSLFWPSHAIHHSDTEMTWTTIFRFHPINRLTTLAIDSGFLVVLGFPYYAVALNAVVRHYYGALIHADLPWTYGWLGKLFVSPAMHRWHHASEPLAYGKNFATVFAVLDKTFGTYYLPGVCRGPLGVKGRLGVSWIREMVYPFRPSAYQGVLQRRSFTRFRFFAKLAAFRVFRRTVD